MAIKFLSGLNLSDITTGSLLKLDSNGDIVAAVAGTDYAASVSLVWSTSGSNPTTAYYNGRVRVGTYQASVEASAKLHVFDYQTTDPKLLIEDGNTGDASMQFKISTQSYVIGIDNSDSDKFILAASTALGTTNVLEVSTVGSVAFQEPVLFNDTTYFQGNVGVGTLTPDSVVEISGTTDGTGTGADAILHVKQNGGWNGNEPWALYVEGYSYLNGFRINANDGVRALHKVAPGGQLGFSVTDTAPITFTQSNSTERMRVHTNGNVGIGTTNPSVKLEIKTSTSDTTSVEGLRLYNAGGGIGAGVKIGLGVGTSYSEKAYLRTDIISGGAGRLFIGVNGSDRVLIDNSGNVGIGTVTTSPYRFNVLRGDGNVAFLTDGATADLAITCISGVTDLSPTTGVLAFGTSSTERMRITSAGNVGIGTTAPIGKLQIGGTSGNLLTVGTLTNNWGGDVAIGVTNGNGVIISKTNTANDTNRVLVFYRDDTNGATIWGYTPSGGGANAGFQIRANASSYFNGGNVGIGTNNPSYKLDVSGSIGGDALINDSTALTLRSDVQHGQGDEDAVISFKQSTNELGKFDQAGYIYATGFKTSGTTGFLKSDGSVDTGTYVSSTGYNNSNWDTAYGWGNHAGLYDALGDADAVQDNLDSLAGSLGTLAYSSATIPTNNNQLTNGAGYITEALADVKYQDATDRKKWSGINAGAAQAKRYRIARVYYCPKHWDDTWQNIEFELLEESYNAAYVRYSLFGYYNATEDQTLNLKLKDFRGLNSDTAKYNLFLGTHTDAGWLHSGQKVYYTDIYVDVSYYKSLKITADTFGHSYQETDPSAGAGITVFYPAPEVSDTTYTNVNKQNTYIGDNYLLWNSSNFSSTNISNWDTAYGWGNHASYGYATEAYVTTAISNLVDSAPAALDTLNELAAALGDDANFSTTVTNSLATKLPLSAGSANKLTDALYVQGTNATSGESVLLRGITSNDGDWLGSIRTANVGAYNQEMRFYTSKANGTTDENIVLTLHANQNATFASGLTVTGTLSASGYNDSNWNTAYGWGNHAGLYDSLGSADAVQDNLDSLAGSLGTAASSASTDFVAVTGDTMTGQLLLSDATGSTGLYITSDTASGNGAVLRLNKSAEDKQVYQTFESDTLYLGVAASQTGVADIGTKGGVSLDLNTNYTTRMRIGSGGDISVGSTNAWSRFTVYASTHSNGISVSRQADNTAALYIGNDGGINPIIASNNADLIFGRDFSGTFTERMRMTNGGNFGIGITNPSYTLDVNGSTRISGILRTTDPVFVNNRSGLSVAHWSASGNTTGAIRITLPGSHTGNWSMLVLRITAYEYNGNRHCVYYVSGHDWTSGWYNFNVTKIGKSDKDIKLGYDSTANKDYVVIGGTTSSWSYGHVTVDVIAHPSFYSGSMDITSGWDIRLTGDLSGITLQTTNNDQVWDSGNDGSGSGLDADTVDGIQASSFLRSDADDSFSGSLTSASAGWIKFYHTNQTDSNDGKIGSGVFASGLNIVGTQTTAGTGRQVRIWGSLIDSDGGAYATQTYVNNAVAAIVDQAPQALDTLNELAAALGDDAAFSTTVSTALGNRLRIDTNAQNLTATEKSNAYTNLDLANNFLSLSGVVLTVNGTDYSVGDELGAADLLAKIKTVDGSTSGLDADLLDGNHASDFASSGFLTNTGGAKIEVQNSQNGGTGRGLYMWSSTDTNWVIYMGEAGTSRSSAGGTAASGIDGRTSHAIRFRVANSTSQIGFLWENASDDALMQLTPDTGHLYTKGRVYTSDQTTHYVDSTRISNWQTAYGWGNHSTQGYLTSTFGVDVTAQHISPAANTTYDLGRDTGRWRIVYCETLDSAGIHEANLANKKTGLYATGTVLVWKDGQAIPSTSFADYMKIGIAVYGNPSPLVHGAEPVLCTGQVEEGDYLVTSTETGHAMALTRQEVRERNLMDCVIGKALESGDGKSHLIKTWLTI
jgi:hypothetical protein